VTKGYHGYYVTMTTRDILIGWILWRLMYQYLGMRVHTTKYTCYMDSHWSLVGAVKSDNRTDTRTMTH